jgi:hypothetical protein
MMAVLVWALMMATACLAIGNHPWLALMTMVMAFVVRCCCND